VLLESEFRDVVEFTYPGDDIWLDWRNRRGFLDFLRSLDEGEVLEFAKNFIVWRDKRLRECAFFRVKIRKEREGGEVEEREEYRVYVPRVRYLRRSYYSWIKDLELPEARYRLITLTFYRHYSLVEVWKNVNKWVSKCLHRVRTYLRRRYGVDVFYLWVIECHKDGYPHVHILFWLSKYIPEWSFEELLSLFQRYWVDDRGNCLCAFQGIDIKYVGRDVERVKEYILKYLVKDHESIWAVEVEGGLVRVRLCALLIWAFKVRLFGISQKLKRLISVARRDVSYLGKVSAYRVWCFAFEWMDFKSFMQELLGRGYVIVDEERVPYLLRGGAGGLYH
jgi:hypothetical protein